eukprot:473717_1
MERVRRLQFIVQTQHDVILIVMETMRVRMLQFIVQTLHEARCDIDCYGYACEFASFTWPTEPGLGSISCNGDWACYNVIFPYPAPNTDHSVTCSYGACTMATIYCPNSARCDIDCYGDDACEVATIYCPNSARCDIDCYGDHACEDATIYCPNSARCDIDCDGDYACRDATIHGSSSGNCDVHCHGYTACYDLSCSGGLTCTDDGEQICNENTMPVWIVFMILSGISACIVYFVLVRTAKVVRYETVVDDIEKEESIKRV